MSQRQCLCFLLLQLLLQLLLTAVSRAAHVDLPLRHLVNEGERTTTLIALGHPERTISLNVRLAVPPEMADAFAATPDLETSADAADLPGQYPALWLPPLHPVVTSGGYASTARWNVSAGGAQLIAQPFVDASSRDTPFSLCLAVSPYGGGNAATGTLALGPGSAIWLRWEYALLTRNRLRLSDTPPPLPDAKGVPALSLPCAHWDGRGRCVVDVTAHRFVARGLHGPDAYRQVLETGALRWLVLDFDAPSGQLPPWLYARLLHAAAHTRLGTPSFRTDVMVELVWEAAAAADAATLVLASSSEVGGGTGTGGVALNAQDADGDASPGAQGNAPLFATSDEAGNDTVVLGRRSVARLFRALRFDTAAATWTASASLILPDGVRALLSVFALVQAALLAFFYAGPLNLGFRDVRPRSATMGIPAALPWMSLLSAALAVAQATLGYVYVGAGFGADAVVAAALLHLARTVVALVVVYAALAIPLSALVLLQWRARGMPYTVAVHSALALALGASFAGTGTLGIVGGLVPLAAISMVAFIALALVAVALFLPTALYSLLTLATSLAMFASALRSAAIAATLGIAGLVQLSALACMTYASVVHALMPMLEAVNVDYSALEIQAASSTAVLTALFVGVYLAQNDVFYILRTSAST